MTPNTPQVSRFPDGGYVIHKLRFNESFSKLRFSVWFSKEGVVLDSEAFDAFDRPRPVPDKVKLRLGAEFGYVVALYRAAHPEEARI